MRKALLISLTFTSAFMLCVGCNNAARDHQAEQARREQVVKELKAIGKGMHEKQASESTTDSEVTNVPEKASDSPPE